ncbi:MAG: hypothetical protein GF383_15280 [Candidatus Lokiarchaeota archaeon]|nr:hypothetical protein [Candidatus Lokiarchaeota archaeon]MBD3342886.1 hypothetical protein [Candidatus Lokiarchaeota archaeon]
MVLLFVRQNKTHQLHLITFILYYFILYFKGMIMKGERIKLSRWLQNDLPHYFPNKGDLVELIETIAEATVPIRGLLERGITSREIQHRLELQDTSTALNLYEEEQIHEDVLTHSIILKALQEGDTDFYFVASEEAEPVLGNGNFGITTDPVDGSSNVAVNRTVGTIVGIFNRDGKIVCSFYVLYGIFTNLVISINGKVAEFVLDTSPYSMTFYHYVYYEPKILPDISENGIKCLGGNPLNWSEKCRAYEKKLIENDFKERYSGSFVGDFHAILKYGGVYSYFLQNGKAKIRLYYEWLPLAFIAKTLGGEFLLLDENDNITTMEDIPSLTKDNITKIHSTTCGALLGSKKAVNLIRTI